MLGYAGHNSKENDPQVTKNGGLCKLSPVMDASTHAPDKILPGSRLIRVCKKGVATFIGNLIIYQFFHSFSILGVTPHNSTVVDSSRVSFISGANKLIQAETF